MLQSANASNILEAPKKSGCRKMSQTGPANNHFDGFIIFISSQQSQDFWVSKLSGLLKPCDATRRGTVQPFNPRVWAILLGLWKIMIVDFVHHFEIELFCFLHFGNARHSEPFCWDNVGWFAHLQAEKQWFPARYIILETKPMTKQIYSFLMLAALDILSISLLVQHHETTWLRFWQLLLYFPWQLWSKKQVKMPKVLEQMAQIFLETLQHAQRHVSSSFGASAGFFF